MNNSVKAPLKNQLGSSGQHSSPRYSKQKYSSQYLLVLSWLSVLLFLSLFNPQTWAQEYGGHKAVIHDVKPLGKGQYSIGAIKVDKNSKTITVPGKIIRHDPPLEFFAVSENGYKAYESFLELKTSAHDFNVACILIGLDGEKSRPAKFHFDKKPVTGDEVAIEFSWLDGKKNKSLQAHEVFTQSPKEPISPRWSYTGSRFAPNGDYMAELSGTIIGFVHDPDSIIEHREGVGIEQYGQSLLNTSILPKVGTPIVLHLSVGN